MGFAALNPSYACYLAMSRHHRLRRQSHHLCPRPTWHPDSRVKHFGVIALMIGQRERTAIR